MAAKTAFVVGWTGGVGSGLVSELIKNNPFKTVYLVGRREVPLPEADDKFIQKTIDFENLDQHQELFSSCNAAFCCLGVPYSGNSKEQYLKVNHDYIVNVARAAKDAGVEEFHLTSAIDANANSFFLASKTKGQVENEIREMGFKHFFIYRPAGVQAKRENYRFGEKAVAGMMKVLFLSRKFLIKSETIGKTMIFAASQPEDERPAEKIYFNSEMNDLWSGKEDGQATASGKQEIQGTTSGEAQPDSASK